MSLHENSNMNVDVFMCTRNTTDSWFCRSESANGGMKDNNEMCSRRVMLVADFSVDFCCRFIRPISTRFNPVFEDFVVIECVIEIYFRRVWGAICWIRMKKKTKLSAKINVVDRFSKDYSVGDGNVYLSNLINLNKFPKSVERVDCVNLEN